MHNIELRPQVASHASSSEILLLPSSSFFFHRENLLWHNLVRPRRISDVQVEYLDLVAGRAAKAPGTLAYPVAGDVGAKWVSGKKATRFRQEKQVYFASCDPQ